MKGLILLTVLALATSSMGFSLGNFKLINMKYFNVETDVQFHLYTLKNPIISQILSMNNTNSFDESNFNYEVPTRILVHGFQSNGELRRILSEAYFTKGMKNINLIFVNWEKASTTYNYVAASRYVAKIGTRTAQFIDFMVENKLVKMSELIVVGFSLGAHIAGITGKSVRTGIIPKIIGLDPASPLFSLNKPNERLHSEDALYVETIHTSKLGFFKPLGVASFYLNGGRLQPGCGWDITGQCSHQAAYKYYAESIYSDQPFIGHFCESLINVEEGTCNINGIRKFMGGEPGAKYQPPGVYYITIDSEEEKSIEKVMSTNPMWFRRYFRENNHKFQIDGAEDFV